MIGLCSDLFLTKIFYKQKPIWQTCIFYHQISSCSAVSYLRRHVKETKRRTWDIKYVVPWSTPVWTVMAHYSNTWPFLFHYCCLIRYCKPDAVYVTLKRSGEQKYRCESPNSPYLQSLITGVLQFCADWYSLYSIYAVLSHTHCWQYKGLLINVTIWYRIQNKYCYSNRYKMFNFNNTTGTTKIILVCTVHSSSCQTIALYLKYIVMWCNNENVT
jgi:hypothetical protein